LEYALTKWFYTLLVSFFTAQGSTVQCKARSCDRMSSVRPFLCPSVCDVGGLWSLRLEFFENTGSFTVS